MTRNIIYLRMSALGYLPERKMLGEVHSFVNTYFH